ncbi:hypothetical protein TNCV_2638481, partial [Trichonephila clavipes]
GHACSHPRVPRAHQAGLRRRSLPDFGLSESVRCHGLGLALLTNGGVQQQQESYDFVIVTIRLPHPKKTDRKISKCNGKIILLL